MNKVYKSKINNSLSNNNDESVMYIPVGGGRSSLSHQFFNEVFRKGD